MLLNFVLKLVYRLIVSVIILSALFLLFQSIKCDLDLTEENDSEISTGILQTIHHDREKKRFDNELRSSFDIRQGSAETERAISEFWQRRRENPEREKKETSIGSYVQVLKQRDSKNRKEIERLSIEIRSLKLLLSRFNSSRTSPSAFPPRDLATDSSNECAVHVKRMLISAEVTKGVRLNNEYEVIPFNYFTLNRIHPADPNPGKRVVEKLIGYKRRDLIDIVHKVLETLNSSIQTFGSKWRGVKSNSTKFGVEDFIEGLYRSDPTTGNQYELYYRNAKSLAESNFKVTVMRPFAPIQTLSIDTFPSGKQKELIHVILPLSGRLESFRNFMEKFAKIGLKNDKRIRLTVVYFGEEGLSMAKAIMSRIVQQRGTGNSLKLLALNETFSRAKGLRVGAESVGDTNDVLLFMCDVGVVFSGRFLDRCRWNAKPGKQVYYPIVFGLYDPHVVYTLQGKDIPPETERLIVSRDTGYWYDFGYEMTCQYRSDFIRLNGFYEDVDGQEGNDLVLYRKYVRSEMKVIRATDPGIFHLWHSKIGEGSFERQKLNSNLYKACIRSGALNEIPKNLPNPNGREKKKKKFEKRPNNETRNLNSSSSCA